MNTKPNDCAYPADNQTQTEGGLTKREYFAAMAMQGIVSNHQMIDTPSWEWLAVRSVEAAEALIKALNYPHETI